MLKTMRTNTKWIMIIVSVCFIGMMIFAWGMDIGGRGSSVKANVVGTVNGEEIPYSYYDNVVKSQKQNAGGERMTMAQERQIHEEAWNSIVMQTLIQQDIEKRKITYTDHELVNFMKNYPPEIAYQIPLFMDGEQFSMSKYQSFINADNLRNPQMAQVLQYIEQDAKRRLPSMKFQQSIMNSVIVTDEDVRQRWLRENEKVEVDWVFVNTNSLTGVSAPAQREVHEQWYEAHKENFQVGERRVLSAVFIPLSPTKEDSTDIFELARSVAEKARSGADFAELANDYTDDPGNTRPDGTRAGGDLGFFGRGRMVPAFEEAAFSLKPGEVSDPVLSRFGYHVIKVDSLKYKEDDKEEVDQVSARHILFSIEPSGKTRDDIENRVTGFYEAVKGGMDFTAQAQIDSLQLIRTTPFEEDAETVRGIPGSSKMLVNRVFQAKKGDVLPVYYTDDGYYIIQVSDVLPAGIAPFEEVGRQVMNEILRERRLEYAENFINRVYQRMQEGKTLQEAVDADEEYKKATFNSGEMYRSYFIPGLGSMNEFVARIFTLENPGDTTGPVITDKGSGIAVLIKKLEIDEDQYEQDKAQLRSRLLSERRNDYINRYLEGLRASAEIVDNRHLFFAM